MFIRKRTYLGLKEQNERFGRIADETIAHNRRLLDELRQYHEDYNSLTVQLRNALVQLDTRTHEYERLQDRYEMLLARSLAMEDVISEQEETISKLDDTLRSKEVEYGDLVATKDYLSAKCKYYAKLLGLLGTDGEPLDTITTSGEEEQ